MSIPKHLFLESDLTSDEQDGVYVEFGAQSLQPDDSVAEVLAGVESCVVSILGCALEHCAII